MPVFYYFNKEVEVQQRGLGHNLSVITQTCKHETQYGTAPEISCA